MARCLREGGKHLSSAEMACHVLDIIEQMINSGRSGAACEMRTQCEQPGLLTGVDRLLRQP